MFLKSQAASVIFIVSATVATCLVGRRLMSPAPSGAVRASVVVVPNDEPGPRRPHRPPTPGEVREMTIKRLGNFSYRHEGRIPEDVKRLNGMRVRLRGYVIPVQQAAHATRFILVPTLGSCCFGQPPGLEHIVPVTCAPGNGIDPNPTIEFIVEGRLHVGEVEQDGNVIALYQVEDAQAKPIAG